MIENPGTITELLMAWSEGDERALEELMPLVYDHLRGMAANHLRRERPDHTLQTAGLVNEAFLRLVQQDRVDWEGRSHFFAIAARMMRRILVDHAKYHGYAKRDNSETVRLTPEAFDRLPTDRPRDIILVEDALEALERNEPVLARIVELRFFGGLKKTEIATVLDMSTATVTRKWRVARAWLYNLLVKGDSELV